MISGVWVPSRFSGWDFWTGFCLTGPIWGLGVFGFPVGAVGPIWGLPAMMGWGFGWEGVAVFYGYGMLCESRGKARYGRAWFGEARPGLARSGEARLGKAWRGAAGQGMARRGEAREFSVGDAIDFDRIRDGDEVWVRGTWRGHLNGDRFALVDLGNCGSRTIITRSAIAGHVPKSWVPEVGDVVEYLSDERECVILGIDEDKAWLKGGGYRFVASFDRLTLIRKGGEK